MGDTLPSIATTFSMTDRNFYLWDKGQLIVIISRTRLAILDTIFVGDKESTLNDLVAILKCCTQWTDHMENILKVVTINIDDDNVEIEENRGTVSHANFPYKPNDISSLPTNCSGYVYMLISLRSNDFCYVGKTIVYTREWYPISKVMDHDQVN